MTSIAFLSSRLMKMRPLPSLTPPSGALPVSVTVATTSPVFASITTAVPVGLAVIDRENLVGRVVVHDAVEAVLARLDLLLDTASVFRSNIVDVESPRVRREAVVRLRRERDAVDARRVRDVAEHLARRAVDDHDVRAARDEDATRERIGGEVVGAAFAADVELLRLVLLRRDGGGE